MISKSSPGSFKGKYFVNVDQNRIKKYCQNHNSDLSQTIHKKSLERLNFRDMINSRCTLVAWEITIQTKELLVRTVTFLLHQRLRK